MIIMMASMTTGIVAIFTYFVFIVNQKHFQNFSYSTSIFEKSGLGGNGDSTLPAQIASITLSVFNTMGAFIANGLVDRVGRRVLLLVSLIGNTVIGQYTVVATAEFG